MRTNSIKSAVLSIFVFTMIGCVTKNNEELIAENIDFAVKQIGHQVELIEKKEHFCNARSVNVDGSIVYVEPTDWTSGFFPGTIWHLFALTGDRKWEHLAKKYTATLDSIQYFSDNHDTGFMIGCSYGIGYRLTREKSYEKVIVQAANSLITRFHPYAHVLQSWNADEEWIIPKGWVCPVIIDNMMNLELLFDATRLSGDSTYYNIAVNHANTTLKNHFRENGSCYHVIDYNPLNGEVLAKHTAQGYSHESTWSRGQAWGIYGFTLMYRETKERKYLNQAIETLNFMLNHPNLEQDMIPYWDMEAPCIPNEPRDASSAAIMASAMYEMSTYLDGEYKEKADQILSSLSSPAYRAILGTNGNFILMHNVGSIPHGTEVDVPINYSDYYFLEALWRKKKLEMNEQIVID